MEKKRAYDCLNSAAKVRFKELPPGTDLDHHFPGAITRLRQQLTGVNNAPLVKISSLGPGGWIYALDKDGWLHLVNTVFYGSSPQGTFTYIWNGENWLGWQGDGMEVKICAQVEEAASHGKTTVELSVADVRFLLHDVTLLRHAVLHPHGRKQGAVLKKGK